MREALVAVFDTETNAERAVRALEANNIPGSAIRRYRHGDPSIPAGVDTQSSGGAPAQQSGVHYQEEPRRSGGGFWSWLTGDEGETDTSATRWRDPNYAETDEQYYARSAQAGNTVVAVYVQQEDADRVMQLLAEQNPMKLQDTGLAAEIPTGATTSATAGATASEQRLGRTHGEEERLGHAHGEPSMARGAEEERIPLAEEQVEVGKERTERPVHVRRYVVERPVEQQVTLQDERVEIERRRPIAGDAGPAQFEERTIETRETTERPVVNKTAAVTEEAVVRRDQSERTETVRDTARKEDVEVERDESQTKRTP